MRQGWAGPILFILLFVIALIAFAQVFPYNNRSDHPLNRILPLGGFILGQEPEAWIGDRIDQRIAGRGRQHRPLSVDVDFIKVGGAWYKVKGPVYITKGGKILGWHQDITREEVASLGRWISQFK